MSTSHPSLSLGDRVRRRLVRTPCPWLVWKITPRRLRDWIVRGASL